MASAHAQLPIAQAHEPMCAEADDWSGFDTKLCTCKLATQPGWPPGPAPPPFSRFEGFVYSPQFGGMSLIASCNTGFGMRSTPLACLLRACERAMADIHQGLQRTAGSRGGTHKGIPRK